MNDGKPAKPPPASRMAVEMWEFGLGMMLAKLHREHPEETDDQLRERLRRQLDARPPDGPFRVITRDHPRWGYLLAGNDKPC